MGLFPLQLFFVQAAAVAAAGIRNSACRQKLAPAWLSFAPSRDHIPSEPSLPSPMPTFPRRDQKP
jgi:hypothetical protein